jgi:hypothetical protein
VSKAGSVAAVSPGAPRLIAVGHPSGGRKRCKQRRLRARCKPLIGVDRDGKAHFKAAVGAGRHKRTVLAGVPVCGCRFAKLASAVNVPVCVGVAQRSFVSDGKDSTEFSNGSPRPYYELVLENRVSSQYLGLPTVSFPVETDRLWVSVFKDQTTALRILDRDRGASPPER